VPAIGAELFIFVSISKSRVRRKHVNYLCQLDTAALAASESIG